METLNFTKSWHYTLAKRGGLPRNSWSHELGYHYTGDICDYIRHVIFGGIVSIIMAGGLLVVASLPIGFVVWVVQCILKHAYVSINFAALAFLLISAAVAISLCVYLLLSRILIPTIYTVSETSFVKETYTKFKDKTCKKVIVND